MAQPAAPKTRFGSGAATRLWGDGFAGDDVRASYSMTDWDHCSPDEYAVVFPKLLPSDGTLPPKLRAHLETCVAARAWRQTRLAPGCPGLEVRAQVADLSAAAELHRAWFADDGTVACLLRQMGLLRTAPEYIIAERRILESLDEILNQVQCGSAPGWTEDREALFAFGSGIHPAYLWAESAASPARGGTAAWLGHLDRGRRALMPPAIAEYLLDAVVNSSGAGDRYLAGMVGAGENARRLRRAAVRRLAGDDPAVSFGWNHSRGVVPIGELRSVVRVGHGALEHA